MGIHEEGGESLMKKYIVAYYLITQIHVSVHIEINITIKAALLLYWLKQTKIDLYRKLKFIIICKPVVTREFFRSDRIPSG